MPCMTSRNGKPHVRQPNRAQLRRDRAQARAAEKTAQSQQPNKDKNR